MSSKFIINLGFAICTIGFLSGVFYDKEIASNIFVIGFYTSVLGFALFAFRKTDATAGQKIMMAGFVFATLAFLPANYFDNKELGNIIFYSGVAIILLGIIKHMIYFKN